MDGKFGYFKNGKLHVRDREEDNPELDAHSQTDLNDNIPSASNPPAFNAQPRGTEHDDVDNVSGDPNSGTDNIATALPSDPARLPPPSPLYSEVVTHGGQRQGGNGGRGSPSLQPGNTTNVNTTTASGTGDRRDNTPSDGGRGFPANREMPVTPRRDVTVRNAAGDSPLAARGGGGSGGRRGGGAYRGSRGYGNTGRSRSGGRPNTRQQCQQSLSKPPPDQTLISDTIQGTPRRTQGVGGRQNSSDLR